MQPRPDVSAEPRPKHETVAVAPPVARTEPRPEPARPAAPVAAPSLQQPSPDLRAEPVVPQPRPQTRPEAQSPAQRPEERPELPAPVGPVAARPQPAAPPTASPGPVAPAPPAPRAAPAEQGADVDEEAILKSYLADLQRALGKTVSERDYPRLARDRGWEGKTYVMLTFGRDGHLKGVSLSRTSGYPILDDKALELVKRMRVPPMPAQLRKIEHTFTMPVAFVLKGKH
jgi:protein TonB